MVRRLRGPPFIPPVTPAAAVVMERLDQLPVLPMVVARLLALDPRSDAYFDEVVELVSLEPTFAARLVAAASAIEVRGRAPIRGVRGAAVRLGARRVSALVTSMAVVRVFVPRTDWERSLWRHAVEVACGARQLARLSGDRAIDPEAAYLAGLLHDLGRFLLFDVAPEELRRVEETSWRDADELVAAERAIVGADHAELGARAAARWGLPNELVEVIRRHHACGVPAELGHLPAKLLEIVRVADTALFGSLHHGQLPLSQLPVAEARAFLEQALPRWYPSPDASLIARLVESERDAERALGLLGLA